MGGFPPNNFRWHCGLPALGLRLIPKFVKGTAATAMLGPKKPPEKMVGGRGGDALNFSVCFSCDEGFWAPQSTISGRMGSNDPGAFKCTFG